MAFNPISISTAIKSPVYKHVLQEHCCSILHGKTNNKKRTKHRKKKKEINQLLSHKSIEILYTMTY